MNNISLPTLDETGQLTPLVLSALDAGATAALDPADPHGTVIVTVTKAADAKAFAAKVAAILPSEPAPTDDDNDGD